MKTEVASTDLERRKQVKLRVRGDISIQPQKYEGRTYYVVKDPVSLRYYRFKEPEYFLISMLDGQHTLDEAQKAFEKRYRPERLSLEDLESFGQQLLKAGLAQNDSPHAGKQLFDSRTKKRRSELMQYFTNILYIKVPIFDPESVLTAMLPKFHWIFTRWFFTLSVLFVLSALMLVLTRFEIFLSRLPSYQEFFSFKSVIYMWMALGVVKVIHEFGHGLSCKAFGGEVHEMGFLFLCLSPAMYCNVSDAWTLPNKWHRIIISFAGIYVELMIAALATFVWWNTDNHPFLNNLSLSLMIVCSVSTIAFNGNPLMRFDGYYVLADWLEIPNLRMRANNYLKRLAMEHILGIELLPEPYMELWRRILFVFYAVVSYIYRWVITFVILTFLATFLRPYKLEVVSNLLAMFAVGSMIGWPIYRLFQSYNKRGRLPDMKPRRVLLASMFVATLLLFFFFVPLPVTRIRQAGLVDVQPDAKTNLSVEVPATLEHLNVKEGEWVNKGKILAQFSSSALQRKLEDAKARETIKDDLVRLYRTELATINDDKTSAAIKEKLASATAELASARLQRRQLEGDLKKLTLRASQDGIVYNLPRADEVGKFWEPDQETPFCSIAQPEKLRILVPVSPSDFALVAENLKEMRVSQKLPVTIRIQGRGSRRWHGQVAFMPSSEARNIPLALSTKAGGPVPLKPEAGDQLIPQSQIFVLGVDIDHPDRAIAPGCLAQVKIHCRYRSLAWWTWRTISEAFDLSLL